LNGKLAARAKEWFDMDVDVSSHPQFDRNHERPVAGEEKVSSSEATVDFRRCTEEHRTASRAFEEVGSRLSSQYSNVRGQIKVAGSPSFAKRAK
jgi:hypothetical protein